MSYKDSTATYDARLERLERQNRRLRTGMTFMAIFLVGGVLLGAAQSGVFDTIVAKRISIIDNNGKEIISLGVGEIGTGLAVNQADGSRAALFGMSNAEQAGGLVLFDNEGRARVGMGMGDNIPSLAFTDPEGHKRISLGGAGQRYGIVVMDAGEMQRVGLGLLDEQPVCFLADEGGVPQIGMSEADSQGFTFSRVGEDGTLIVLGE